jgi:hypothetical protein
MLLPFRQRRTDEWQVSTAAMLMHAAAVDAGHWLPLTCSCADLKISLRALKKCG